MHTSRFFDDLSLPIIFILLLGIFALSYELGFRFGCWRKVSFKDISKSQAGAVMGSLFALSAFFLAFTFGSANSRHEALKELVLEETNVIGTAYLRAQFMPDPYRAKTMTELERYVDLRLQATKAGQKGDMSAVMRSIDESEIILDTIWQQAVAVSHSDTVDSVLRGLFVEAINEVIDTHSRRVTMAFKRLPIVTLRSIGLTIILTISVLGFQAGLSGVRSVFATLALVLSLSFVCILILTLDRPGLTINSVSQQPMLDLKASMPAKQ